MGHTTFLDVYEREIAPRLMEIDVTLKTAEGEIPPAVACHLLDIPQTEVSALQAALNIDKLDAGAFPRLMRAADSPICALYRRELAAGCRFVYAPKDIAYIYGLEAERVAAAFAQMGIAEATPALLPLVFDQLPA